MPSQILNQLYRMIREQKSADPERSAVARLYKKGARQIAKKLGEEAVELVIDSLRLEDKPGSESRRRRVVDESADLLFHWLVLMAHHDIKPAEVFDALERRRAVGPTQKQRRRDS
jgi:phosphoribosyl-ATP pyrophosphohydrolase